MSEAAVDTGSGVGPSNRELQMPAVLGFSAGDRTRAPADAAETTLEDAAIRGTPVLALYRAPWVAFLEDGEDHDDEAAARWLAEWIRFHRDLLVLHRRFPERVLLVNAGRLGDGGSLISYLRDHGVACDDGDAAAGATPEPGSTGLALRSLLAAGLANACPDAWSVYEEMESRALLLGREPEFRGTDGVADLSDPGALLAGFASLRGAIAMALEEASATAPPAAPEPDPLAQEVATLRQENELLGLHLEQVLEELQFHSDRGKQLAALLQEAGEVSEAARLLISELRSGAGAPG